MPPEIERLTHEILDRPVKVALQRKAAPAAGVTQAAYPVPQKLKSALLLELLTSGTMDEALVFTRTKHRANRLTKFLEKHDIPAERIHGNRSQAQRTKALAGFKRGDFRVLVATDIAARGIDVEALGHVVNFDVPAVPEDYIHRVGRTARAEMTGEAFTLVSPEEEQDFGRIERAVGTRIERIRLDGFDYDRTAEALEVPRAERIRAIQEKRREDRARAAAKVERRQANGASTSGGEDGKAGSSSRSGGRRRRRRRG